jgi:polyisoprenoid-binding protein YceI
MTLPTGRHTLGPDNARLEVRTYREGVAAKAGHDLIIEVTRWDAIVDLGGDDPGASTVELNADSRSLEVREGLRGVKPLTDKDRNEIRKNIDEKILGGKPISFRSTSVRPDAGGARLSVDGELTMAGSTRPITADLGVGADGRLSGTIAVTQSAWGIKPYRGLMGALKVRDDVEVVVDATLPAG